MAQADTTSLHDSHHASPDELTHVSEIIQESGIPVAENLKDRMMSELARLTEEDADTSFEKGQRRSA